MGVIPCSAVAPSSKSDRVTFMPRISAVAAVTPPGCAARGCHQRDQLFLLVPTPLTTLVLVECGERTIIGYVLEVFPVPSPFGSPCVGFPASGAARRVGGSANFPTKVVVSESEVR